MSTKPIEILTEEESTTLINWTINHSFKHFDIRLRDTTMIVLMLDAGLRVGECSQLPRTSLVFAGQPTTAVIVPKSIAKNKRERCVPVSSQLNEFIRAMQNKIWKGDPPGPEYYCFYSSRPDRPLSTRQIERIVKHNSLMSIKRSVHPHVLRHTFATKMMGRTSMRVVQALLGHKHISSTQIYTHPNQEDLRKAINGTPSAKNSQ